MKLLLTALLLGLLAFTACSESQKPSFPSNLCDGINDSAVCDAAKYCYSLHMGVACTSGAQYITECGCYNISTRTWNITVYPIAKYKE